MPVKHAIWTIGKLPAALLPSKLSDEDLLEEMIVNSPEILSTQWMLIGQQVRTAYGKFICG